MPQVQYQENVFINCPFDNEYDPIFKAVIFTVFACGFTPRCAMEVDDASQVRYEKITRIIGECKYGIHDLSRTQLDRDTGLPRFNMPLELGLFLGAGKYGNTRQREKVCLILDCERYRYQRFISDIAGQDPRSHNNNPETAIKCVRDWLTTATRRQTIPGDREIKRRFQFFMDELPAMCRDNQVDAHDLTFIDFLNLISDWLNVNSITDMSPDA